MSQLLAYASALDNIRFYAQNMANAQFDFPLQICPFSPYNKPVNDRNLHRLINTIERDFDATISRSGLDYPTAPTLYRFRSIRGQYTNRYLEDQTKETLPNLSYDVKVPERGNMSACDFARWFLDYTANQVRSYMYLVCLDPFSVDQNDCFLPEAPPAFEIPDTFVCGEMLKAHDEISYHMLQAIFLTYSDARNHHPMLRDYGRDVILPLVAEARNVVYAAFPELRESK